MHLIIMQVKCRHKLWIMRYHLVTKVKEAGVRKNKWSGILASYTKIHIMSNSQTQEKYSGAD